MAKRRVFNQKSEDADDAAEPDQKKMKAEEGSNGVSPAKEDKKESKKKDTEEKPKKEKKEKEKEKKQTPEKPAKEREEKERSKEKLEISAEHDDHSRHHHSADEKITIDNQITHPTMRHYSVLSLDAMKDKSFKNLRKLYLNSVIWDDALLSTLQKRIPEMTDLETLVIKEHKIGLNLSIHNKNLKNFGLFARELRSLELDTPNLESITIVHTLHCGTAFFADLLEKCPKLKYVNLWENFGIIQFTAHLPELETLVLSRTSATKLSFQHVLDSYTTLKTLICSSVDVVARTVSSWKKKYDVDVIIDATKDFFFVYIERLDDFENPELFHEEQKY